MTGAPLFGSLEIEMAVEVITKVTCDDCETLITDTDIHVDAQAYGKDFHLSCMKILDSGIVSMLGIDDIYVRQPNEPPTQYYSNK